MRKDGEFGRFLVTEADVARAQALATPATPTTPATNPPAVYPDDAKRKLRRYKKRIIELEQALAELEEQQDDDAAPNPGPQTIAEQLDQARRDAEAAKAYNAAINPPAPTFDLAKLVQSLAPIVAPLVQQQLAKQQEAQKPTPPTPPAPPEWMALVAELQRRGADPAALLANVQSQDGAG